MDEANGTAHDITVTLDHIDENAVLKLALDLLITEHNLLAEIVAQILALMPDPKRWRLILSGDLPATMNALEGRSQHPAYTTARGSGYVGGLTVPQDDGTFLFILDANNLAFPPIESDTLEEVVGHALASARHLGRHEAGHALLKTRGENAEEFRDISGLDPSAAGWSHIVARDIDDFRIERHVREHLPSAYSHVDGLPGAIDHLASVLADARENRRTDISAHADASDYAVSAFVKVVAYLSAELGLDSTGAPIAPTPLPEKWNRYLATHWESWSAAFHRLRPADSPMTTDELASVTRDLSELTVQWMASIGYRRGISEDGELYAFWTEEEY